MSTRNVRRRLDQFLQNPSCEANALSVAMDMPMRDVAAHDGDPTREGVRLPLCRGERNRYVCGENAR
jgi:hypothetical protein